MRYADLEFDIYGIVRWPSEACEAYERVLRHRPDVCPPPFLANQIERADAVFPNGHALSVLRGLKSAGFANDYETCHLQADVYAPIQHASIAAVQQEMDWIAALPPLAEEPQTPAEVGAPPPGSHAMIDWRDMASAPLDGRGFLAFGIHDQSPPDAARGVKPGDHWWAIILFDVWRTPHRFVFAKDGASLWSTPLCWAPLTPPSQFLPDEARK
jgi:hypothetical protein